MRTREVIETEKEIGLPLLGYTVVTFLKGIEIDQASILAILSPLGLDKHLPGLPEPQTALRRAVSKWIKQLSKMDLGIESDDKTLLRNINLGKKSPTLAMALVVESKDLEEWGLNYLVNLRIFYDKTLDALSLTLTGAGQGLHMDAQERQLLAELEPLFRHYQSVYLATDLGRMLSRAILDLDATSMREKGGTYFIPYSRLEDLQILKDVIELELPAPSGEENTSSLNAFPVIDRKGARQQMSQLSHKAIMAEIEALDKDLHRFVEQASSVTDKGKPGKIRKESVVSRLAEYQGLKNKAKLYGETLGLRQEEIMKGLQDLQEKAMALIEVDV